MVIMDSKSAAYCVPMMALLFGICWFGGIVFGVGFLLMGAHDNWILAHTEWQQGECTVLQKGIEQSDSMGCGNSRVWIQDNGGSIVKTGRSISDDLLWDRVTPGKRFTFQRCGEPAHAFLQQDITSSSSRSDSRSSATSNQCFIPWLLLDGAPGGSRCGFRAGVRSSWAREEWKDAYNFYKKFQENGKITCYLNKSDPRSPVKVDDFGPGMFYGLVFMFSLIALVIFVVFFVLPIYFAQLPCKLWSLSKEAWDNRDGPPPPSEYTPLNSDKHDDKLQ